MRKVLSSLFLIVAFLSAGPVSYAGFYDLGTGARPLGMGHAFTAVADDVNAIYYNPAGLVYIMATEVTFMYAPMLIGLTDGSGISDFYGAFAMRLGPERAIGAAWTSRYCTGGAKDANAVLLQENTFYGSYAMWLLEKLAFGANIKVPMHSYAQTVYASGGVDNSGNVVPGLSDSVFANGYSRVGFSADVGFLYFINGELTLGMSVQNIFSTSLALESAVYDPAPLYVRAGAGYKIPVLAQMENFTVSSEAVYHIGGMKNDVKVHSGMETWFLNRMLAARFGFGLGSNSYSDISFGGTCMIAGKPEYQIDYSWNCPLSGVSISGNHRFACTLRL